MELDKSNNFHCEVDRKKRNHDYYEEKLEGLKVQ